MKKMFKTFSTSIFLSLLLTNQLALASTFSDVNDQTPYSKAINWMAKNEVINGHSDGSFKPSDCVNRAEILKMVYLANEETISGGDTPASFSDIDQTAWYAPFVNHSAMKGTVKGYSDGTFRPGNCVNRVEAIKIALLEFYDGELPEINLNEEQLLLKNSYIDINYEDWYGDYAELVLINDLVGQFHGNTVSNPDSAAGLDRYFIPNDGMSRGEVAEMLYRVKAVKDNEEIAFREELEPQTITSFAFDNCKMLSEYSDKPWFTGLATNLAGENLGPRLNIFATRSDSCLSIDGETLIFIVPESEIGSGDARVYKYDTKNFVLTEASYFGFPTNENSNSLLIALSEFGARDKNVIPVSGILAKDDDTGTQFIADFNFVEGTLTLRIECPVEIEVYDDGSAEATVLENNCVEILLN